MTGGPARVAPATKPPSDRAGAHTASSQGVAHTDSRLDALRALLIDAEQRDIAELRRRLDDPQIRFEELRPLLPALFLELERNPDAAVGPVVPLLEKALHKSSRDDPQAITDALYPVLGPLIWTSVSSAFNNLMDSLNTTLERSLSPQGLHWRWEAYRTGKSIGEVALLRSLVYRVEYVYLIENESGVLLQSAGEQIAHDDDLMSGMLTAIQDFVRESFTVGATETLDTLRVGDFSVWIERGPRAFLAAVIRGTPPPELRERLRSNLAEIHHACANALASFTGATETLTASRPMLAACLLQEAHAPQSRRPAAAYAVTLLALLGVGIWIFLAWQDSARLEALRERLQAEPGVVVLEGGGWADERLSLLRDPVAAEPAEIVAAHGLDAAEVPLRVTPYLSLDPEIVLRRARETLAPPASVSLALDQGTLRVGGSAPPRWIARLRDQARTVPGVGRLDEDELRASRPWGAAQAAIEQTVIRFDPGAVQSSSLGPSTLAVLAEQIDNVVRELRANGFEPVIEVRGSADPTGNPDRNRQLSGQRAEWVRGVLVAGGLPAKALFR